MNNKITPHEVEALNNEKLVKEHKLMRPVLEGLPAVVGARTVGQVLNETEADNSYLENVPPTAWAPFQHFKDILTSLAETKNIMIHIDTDDWTFLVHERNAVHPQPKALRSDPPMPVEYMSLFAAYERAKEWRHKGFTPRYQPGAERFGNRPLEQHLVFNIGFRYIRLHWTPKGFVWTDSFNTAIPFEALQNTIYFPTIKERASGHQRQADQQGYGRSMSVRFQGGAIPDAEEVRRATTPIVEDEVKLAQKAKLYHGQDLYDDSVDTLGEPAKPKQRPTKYVVCSDNKTEPDGTVRAVYSSKVAAEKHRVRPSDVVLTLTQYHKQYGRHADESAVEPAK